MNNTKKRYDISQAEEFANQIITSASLRKKEYINEAHSSGHKQSKIYEEELIKMYLKKNYDLSKEEKDLENGKKDNIKNAERDFEKNEKKVVEFLIEQITSVKIEVHRNIIRDFEILKIHGNI